VLIVRLNMRVIRTIFTFILGLCILSNLAPSAWSKATVDQSLSGELLNKYVKHGVVDYRGLKRELEAKKDNIKITYLYYDWSLNKK